MNDSSPKPRRSPMYRLLEDYVLDAIGHLPADEEAAATGMVKVAFRSKAPWRRVLREEFGLTPALSQQLADLWAQSQSIAKEKGSVLEPRAFASMVVEDNFSDAIEMLVTEVTRRFEDTD